MLQKLSAIKSSEHFTVKQVRNIRNKIDKIDKL